MIFAVIVIPLLIAVVALWARGRLAAATALLLALLYVDISDLGIRYHGWPSVAQPLVLLFAITVLVRQARRRGGFRRLGESAGFWRAAAIYLAVVLASSIWALDGHAAVHQAGNLARDLVIVYVIVEVFDDPHAQRLGIWALIGAGTVLASLSVLQALTHTYGNSYLGLAKADVREIVGTTNGYRSAGPINDPNFYGLMLAAVVPLAVLRFRDERRPLLRVTTVVCALLLVAGVVLTYSRGALVALALALVGLVLTIRIPKRWLLLAGGGLVLLAAISPSHYLQRVTSLGHVDHSFQGRAGSQFVALAMFADHPLLGVGADNYQARYVPYARQLHASDPASTVHDLYLATASETGVIGLVAFGGAMFAVFWRGWQRRANAARLGERTVAGLATASLFALATYLVGCLFLPLAYPRYLWIFVGLALSISLPSMRIGLTRSRAPMRPQ